MFLFIFDYFMIECFVVFSSNCIETKIKYFLEYELFFLVMLIIVLGKLPKDHKITKSELQNILNHFNKYKFVLRPDI